MLNINKKTLPFLLTAFGCLFFIIFTFIAMLTYPGGTRLDPNTVGYNFVMNYFSDLGITIAHSGASNIVSHALFSISILVAGSLLIPFFIAIPQFFSDTTAKKWIIRVTSGFGVIVALGYIGVGFTPANINPIGHYFSVIIRFLGTLPLVAILTIFMFLNKEFPRYLSHVLLILTLVSFFYVLLMFFNPGRSTTIGLLINVVGQKVIIYTEMITLTIEGIGIAKFVEQK